MTYNFWIRLGKLKSRSYSVLNVCRHLAKKRPAGSRIFRFPETSAVGNRISFERWIFSDNVDRSASESGNGRECWHCRKSIEPKDFSCPFCRSMQRPSPAVTFFDVFGLEQKYDLDVENVAKKFKELQKIFHPDKTANKLEVKIFFYWICGKMCQGNFSVLVFLKIYLNFTISG